MVTSVKVRLNTARCDRSGRFPLGIQLLKNGRKRILPLGLSLEEAWFDKRTQTICALPGACGGRKRQREINEEIGKIRRRLEQLAAFLERQDPGFPVEALLEAYRRLQDERYLTTFTERECVRLEKSGLENTKNRYRSLLRSVERFCIRTRRSPQIVWSDITERFVTDYRRYLEERGLKSSSVAAYLSVLRALYRKAAKAGVAPQPGEIFRGNLPRALPAAKRAVEAEVIRRILNASLESSPALEQARDVFAASLYMEGMAVRDLMNLQRRNICDGVITYRRSKTGKVLVFRIVPELQQLLDRYASDDSHLFPFLLSDRKQTYRDYKTALRRLNRNLLKLECRLGIPFHLSTYVARHSWASLAQACNISIEKISQALGHTSTKTTQIYLKGFHYRAIDEVNETVIRCFRGENGNWCLSC